MRRILSRLIREVNPLLFDSSAINRTVQRLYEQLKKPTYYPQFSEPLQKKPPELDIESKINITFKEAIDIVHQIRAIEDNFLKTVEKVQSNKPLIIILI